MTAKLILSWEDIQIRARVVAQSIQAKYNPSTKLNIYPIPRGGIPAAQMVMTEMLRTAYPVGLSLVEDPSTADIYIDDLIDSGATENKYNDRPFYCLLDKRVEGSDWVEFPWERISNESGPEDNVRRLIEYLGDDPNREGLLETPGRVVRSYGELFSGYDKKPEDVIKTFADGSCDEMVIARNIEFVSTCEHHMLPFFGRAHIAYIPNGRVIGISKLVRLLEIFSRRLQIQERLCQQVTTALDEHLKPKGSACILEAKHLCMVSRGVEKQHSEMITTSLTGVFRDSDNDARREFLSMTRG